MQPLTNSLQPLAGKPLAALFSLLFPEDCRICGDRLENISRLPICPVCLAKPARLNAPYACSQCQTPFLNQYPLDQSGRCALCRSGLAAYSAAFCYGSYEGTLRDLIHLFKYSSVRTLDRPLSNMLDAALPGSAQFDLVVPVPLHWKRQWQRGFNQAELLARRIGRMRGWKVAKALERKRPTRVQAGLTGRERRQNVRTAFSVKRNAKLDGARVLLVDDVLTTGSTAHICAAALKAGGAADVAVVALARVDRRANSFAGSNRTSKFSLSAAGGST